MPVALEPLLQIGISGDMLGQDLDGDGAVEAGVGGFVDLAHAPGAERGVDLVGAERGAWLKWHRSIRRHPFEQLLRPVEYDVDVANRRLFLFISLDHQKPLAVSSDVVIPSH